MQASLRLVIVAVAVVVASITAHPQVARAQTQQVEADFKGSVGLGLVGAELGAVIPALAGLDQTWVYIVFPALGAAGGAVAGYFALDQPDHVELSIGALTLGMALVIPALVVTLSATAYDAGDAETARLRPRQSRASDRSAAVRAHSARPAEGRAAGGMVRLNGGELALAVPALSLVPGGRASEPFRVAGVHVALMSGQF